MATQIQRRRFSLTNTTVRGAPRALAVINHTSLVLVLGNWQAKVLVIVVAVESSGPSRRVGAVENTLAIEGASMEGGGVVRVQVPTLVHVEFTVIWPVLTGQPAERVS